MEIKSKEGAQKIEAIIYYFKKSKMPEMPAEHMLALAENISWLYSHLKAFKDAQTEMEKVEEEPKIKRKVKGKK